MPVLAISASDLAPFATIDTAKAQAMIDDAMALAVMAAPCLADEITSPQLAAARAVIRGAILRWNDAGTGVYTQRQRTLGSATIGESMDTRQERRSMFQPSEITALQRICSPGRRSGRAFEVDTMPPPPLVGP